MDLTSHDIFTSCLLLHSSTGMNIQGKGDASYSWLGARGVELRINLKIEKKSILISAMSILHYLGNILSGHFGKSVLLAVYMVLWVFM